MLTINAVEKRNKKYHNDILTLRIAMRWVGKPIKKPRHNCSQSKATFEKVTVNEHVHINMRKPSSPSSIHRARCSWRS